jgi:phosphomannomutase
MGIFKAYDIRGIYGKDVDEGIFYRIARAYAQFLRPSKVAVARDCRKSSPSLFQAFAKGLIDEGVDVIDLGLASTPISYFANGTLGVDGSVMITASHNTREWNGCKLCRANAVPISGATGIKDIEKIFEGINEFDPPAGVGEITKVDVSKAYAEHVRSFTKLSRPLHLALDFANGMGIAFVPNECVENRPGIRFIPLHNWHQALYMCILYDKWLDKPVWDFVEIVVKAFRKKNHT